MKIRSENPTLNKTLHKYSSIVPMLILPKEFVSYPGTLYMLVLNKRTHLYLQIYSPMINLFGLVLAVLCKYVFL